MSTDYPQKTIRFAARELDNGASIPAVAGMLLNKMPSNADFDDYIQVANTAQLKLENNEIDVDATIDITDSTDDELTLDAPDNDSQVTDAQNHETDIASISSNETVSDSGSGESSWGANDSDDSDTDNETSSEPDEVTESIQDPDEQGQSSWSA